jgi:hypothetical protein
MTRKLFWMTVGAGIGISGYRKANRVVRGLTLAPVRRRPRQHGGLAGFARDVRDGMDLYEEQQRLNIERRRAAGGPTLGWRQVSHQASEAGVSRNGSSAPSARH